MKKLRVIIFLFICMFIGVLNVKAANDNDFSNIKLTITSGETLCVYEYSGKSTNKYNNGAYDKDGQFIGDKFKYIIVKIKKNNDANGYSINNLTFSGQTLDYKVDFIPDSVMTNNCNTFYPFVTKNSSNSYTIWINNSKEQNYWEYNSSKTSQLTGKTSTTEANFSGCNVPSSGQQIYLGTYVDDPENHTYNYFSTNSGEMICPATTKKSGSDIVYDRIGIDIKKFSDASECKNWQSVKNPNYSAGATMASAGGCKYFLVAADEDLSRVGGQTLTEEGTLITTYVQYNNSNSPSIRIIKNSDGTYKAALSSGSSIEAISSSLISTNFSDKASYPKYLLKGKGSDTYSFSDTKTDEFDEIYINVEALSGISGIGEEEIYATCEDLFGDSLLTLLDNYVIKVIQFGVPILLILLTSFDFAKVVFIDDKEGIQNAFKRFIRRLIAAILIILTPEIIILIARLAGAPDSVQDCAKTIRNMNITETSN